MSSPDIRVKLTPEGVNEVIAAFRKVQSEGRKTTEGAARDTASLSNAVRELKSVLPTIGLAAAAVGAAALAKQALATADATGKMAERFGGTTEEISALNLAFRTNESDQDGVQRALQKTATLIEDFRNGSTAAAQTLKQLGVDGNALGKLSGPRQIEALSAAIAKLPPGSQRAALSLQVFGKEGAQLTQALNAVGKDGIDPFIERARQLGVLIDGDLAAAAAAARDNLGLIKIQAEGVATQFVAGLAPAVADAMGTFSEAVTGDGVNGIRKFGEVVGFVVRSVVAVFTGMGKIIGASVAQTGSYISELIDGTKKLATLDFKGANEAAARGIAERAAIAVALREDLIKIGKDLVAGPRKIEAKKNETNQAPLPGVDPNAKATAAARLAFIRSQLDNEAKLQDERLKAQDEANKRNYELNLISLGEYFAKRRQILDAQAKIELDSLRRQRAAIASDLASSSSSDPNETEADRIKKRQALATIDSQIAQRQAQAQREAAALDGERVAALEQLTDQQRAGQIALATAENRRHDVFMLNLQTEIKAIRELGVRAGESAEEIEANVKRMTAARTSQFNFEEIAKRGQDAMTSFNRDAEQIKRDQEAGVTTQLQGEVRLIELERQRLGVLQQLATEMLAAAKASGDDAAIAKAQQFADSVAQISVSFQAATNEAAKFKQAGVEGFQSGLEDLLTNVDKIKGLGDAFKQLAVTVARSMAKIAAEILARQATLALLKAFGSGVGGGGGAGLAGAHWGGHVKGYARGDLVRGPKLPVAGPDKIPAMLEDGEFITRRAVVRQPGVLDFLRALNEGRLSMSRVRALPRFATGGVVGAAPAPARQAVGDKAVRIVNVLDKEFVSEGLNTPSSERVILNIIERNAGAVNRKLGR
jgi:hypothetical protein